jgi:hydrogenase nickel incorporation protein HypA/HybF
MHEMGIAVRVVEIAISAIPPDIEDARIERINMRIGRLTAVVPESLHFCFNIARADTPLARASLVIEETPIVVECNECGAETTIDRPPFACSECGSGLVTVVSGRELEVLSIELADPEVVATEGRD